MGRQAPSRMCVNVCDRLRRFTSGYLHSDGNANIVALRFVFVMMIFMSHFSYRGILSFEAGGDCGVAFFFVLSGFCMSMGYGHRVDDKTFSFRRYAWRRLLKIYPLHWLCLALFLVIFRPPTDHKLLLNALLLQSWIPDPDYYFSYNGVSWFLSSLLFHYMLFPTLWRVADRFTLTASMTLCLVIYVLVPYNRINALLYVAPWIRIFDFFFGIMLYKFYRRSVDMSCSWWCEWLLLGLLVVSVAVYPYCDAKLRNAPLYWCVLLPLIFFFVRESSSVGKYLRCGVLQWLGGLSMPIFMLHPIVFRCMFHFLPFLPPGLMLVVCFAVTVVMSWAVDRFLLSAVERIRHRPV